MQIKNKYVSRGGLKLEKAIEIFKIAVQDKICVDLGSSTGGFVDCLLQHGAKKVYAVETGYGLLDWKLRNDQRVVVMEKTNAFHVKIPEKADIVTIDSSWTKQDKIIPRAIGILGTEGIILTLIKPHYEAGESQLYKGKLEDSQVDNVVKIVCNQLVDNFGDKVRIAGLTESPVLGLKGKNREFILYLAKLPYYI